MRARDCAGWLLVVIVFAAMIAFIALIAELPLPEGWLRP